MKHHTAETLLRRAFPGATDAIPHNPIPPRTGSFTVWGETPRELDSLIASRHLTSRITGQIKRASHMPMGGWVLTADPRCIMHALGFSSAKHAERAAGHTFCLPGPTVLFVTKMADAGHLQAWADVLDGYAPVSWHHMHRCAGVGCWREAVMWDERTIGWCEEDRPKSNDRDRDQKEKTMYRDGVEWTEETML